MNILGWAGARAVAAALMLAAMLASADAVGAFATGACGAYGHARRYQTDAQANAAALAQCKDSKCRVVATVRGECMAFAIDGANPCGAHGIGAGVRLSTAQNRALRACYKQGGQSCVVRAFACD